MINPKITFLSYVQLCYNVNVVLINFRAFFIYFLFLQHLTLIETTSSIDIGTIIIEKNIIFIFSS
jgi:hypothetical protein